MTVGTATCELCGETHPADRILDHLRAIHPDQYGDGPEHWPDGQVVIIDTTLTPEDFTR